jgi:hypothetical protein
VVGTINLFSPFIESPYETISFFLYSFLSEGWYTRMYVIHSSNTQHTLHLPSPNTHIFLYYQHFGPSESISMDSFMMIVLGVSVLGGLSASLG